MTDQCETLDESLPFLPTGWQAEHIGDQDILGPGPPARPRAGGRLIRGEGLVAQISNDYYRSQLLGRTFQCHLGTARLLGTGNNWTRPVGHAVRRPYSDSEESVNDVWYAEEHDTTVQQVSRQKGRLTQMANNSCGEGCAQLDDFKWFLPAE